MKAKEFIEGRIVGGHSLHSSVNPEKCSRGLDHKGPWRVVECGGHAGPDRDIIECGECGKQVNTRCNFDEDMS